MPESPRYLHGVDLMRVFFILGVLLNHTTTAFIQQLPTTSAAHTALLGTHLLIHFTRMGFMCITGIVLTHQYGQTRDWGPFWRRRFTASGLPYLLWNALYLLLTAAIAGSWGTLDAAAHDAFLHGNQFYMYYLVITFQFYLAFPLVCALFRRLAGHHLALLVVSFTAQLAVVTWIKYALPGVDRSHWLWWCRAYGINLVTYQFYLLLGVAVRLHWPAVRAALTRHLRAWVTAAGLLGLGTIPYYFWNRNVLGLAHTQAVSPHQPYMLVYDTVVILAALAVAARYADRRLSLPPRLTRSLHRVAAVSFGIYLDQTLVLGALRGILGLLTLPTWAWLLALPVGYAAVVAGAYAIARLCQRTRWLGVWIGQPSWLPSRYPAPPTEAGATR